MSAVFDCGIAAQAATLADVVYKPWDQVKTILGSAFDIDVYDHDNAQGMIVTGESLPGVFVVFRGTQVTSGWSWGDIKANIELGLTSWPAGGRAHRGYAGQLMAIWSAMYRKLCAAHKPPIYLTGHSLGGAVATLAATVCPEATALYTFGSPKPGDRDFHKAVRCPHFRIVHGCDIAPKYPRWWNGYVHGGELYKISRRGRVSKAVWSLSWEIPVGVVVGTLDHRIGEYAAKLRGASL